MEFPDIINKLGDLNLVDSVGKLYTDLGDDGVPVVADKLEDMQTIQSQLEELVSAVGLLQNTITEQEDKIKSLNDTNTKLMYNQINANKPDSLSEDEKEDEELDEALDNIEIDGDEDEDE